jgi:hypothetical protein
MDFSLRSVGKVSSLSGRPFEPEQPVVSFLFRGADGELERADLHEDEVAAYEPPSSPLCRWAHHIKDPTDEEAEARRSALLSAEELFFALYEAESEAPSDEAEAVAADRRTLLTLLCLLLERKRVLKARGRGGLYWHPGRKEEFRVQPVNLTPELLLAVQEQLSQLV